MTLANGGDNIAVYTPLFVSQSGGQQLLCLLVFVLLTALFCFVGKHLGQSPAIRRLLERSDWLCPLLELLLGLYLLLG